MRYKTRQWELKCEWIRRVLTRLRLNMLENHVSRSDVSYLPKRKREKLSMIIPSVIIRALSTNLTKFCVLQSLTNWSLIKSFWGWSCKESLVRKVQRCSQALDKTEVRTASLVGRKERMWVITGSGILVWKMSSSTAFAFAISAFLWHILLRVPSDTMLDCFLPFVPVTVDNKQIGLWKIRV